MALQRLFGAEFEATADFEFVQVSETYGEAKGAARAADLVVRKKDSQRPSSFILEVQLGIDEEKRCSWPLYAAAERARQGGGHVHVLVVTPSKGVARWAAQPIELDPHNRYQVGVFGPEQFPSFETPEQASESLGLALLWALGKRAETPEIAAQAAHLVTLAASTKSDQVFVTCYDALRERLDEAIMAHLEKLMELNPENFSTEFSRKHVAVGAIGATRKAILEALDVRGIDVRQPVRDRINSTTDLDLLAEWHRKAITVSSAEQLFED